MSLLETQLHEARHRVVTDGYEMSIGELASLYKSHELVIDPEFQRLYRWDPRRKTNFIESLLLGIPIPPLFVFQGVDGTWELIDGLQRTSTILEFMGDLVDSDGKQMKPLTLGATSLLPALAGVTWAATTGPCLTSAQRLDIRRARIRVEILKRESNDTTKYELFHRLNTGGVALSEQEVRNCTLVMIKPSFHRWLQELSKHDTFMSTTAMNIRAVDRQADLEQVLRFFAFLKVPYEKGLDVNEYLDKAAVFLAMDDDLNQEGEARTFCLTFDLIHKALGRHAFRRWNGSTFAGKFLQSVFEVVATGVAMNLDSFRDMGDDEVSEVIKQRSKDLWGNSVFTKNSGAGVRGTDRLANLLPMAKDFMVP